jgi:peroxiredoxin
MVVAALAGAVLACASVVTVLAFAGDEPDIPVDGEAVLDEPGIYAEPIVTAAPAVGARLPELALPDAGGAEVALASFEGRPLVVNVWYSWCPGCATELRDFAEVSGELAGEVQFVGVNPMDEPDTMTEFAAARGVDYPLLLDSEKMFVDGAGITAFPTTLLVSSDGVIVEQTGPLTADELRTAIAEAFPA